MITERLKIWILLLVVAGCGTGTALAQKMVKVSGTVYNIAENRKVPFSDVTVDVYAAKTVAVGEDMKKILDSNDQEKTLLLDQEGKTTTDENGYYEILVPDNGALIFKVGLSPSVLKEVRHQMKIDVSIDEGVMLESVTVTAMRLVLKPEPKAPKMIGNMLIPYNTFKLPPYFGNRFSRLIIQPYVLDCETNDTVTFARPSVYDGKEYALTQERKMGYDMDRDPLRPYIKAEALTTRAMNLDWTDTIIVPDPNRNYSCFAIVNLEDYSASNSRTYQINTCQTKTPDEVPAIQPLLGADGSVAAQGKGTDREKKYVGQDTTVFPHQLRPTDGHARKCAKPCHAEKQAERDSRISGYGIEGVPRNRYGFSGRSLQQ